MTGAQNTWTRQTAWTIDDGRRAHRRNNGCPVLLLLFVGSGCAALIYEIVWFQMLELFVGSSSVSIGVLLGTFMGGMCLGSFLLPRYHLAAASPAAVYALLEIAIGVIGLLLIVVLPLVGRVYTAWGGYGVTGYLLRGLVASICLLPPTLAMGATLPAVARWVQTTPSGVSWLGFFYAGNIAGAVMGTLLAGFYLLRVYDMNMATYVAAAINVAVGGLGLLVASRTPATSADAIGRSDDPESRDRRSRSKASSDSGARVRRDRAVGFLRAGRAGDLDAPAQPAVRRLDLHVFAHPRRVSDRPRHRQQPRVDHREERRAAARRARLVPAAQRRRDGVERLHADGVAAVLADQHVDHDAASGTTSSSISCARSGPCCPGRFCGARAFRWRSPRSRDEARTRAARRRRLRGQTVGAIVGSVIASLDARVLVRLAARAAGADDRLGHVRPAPARSGAAELSVRTVSAGGTTRCAGCAPVVLVIALGVAAFLIRTVPPIPGILVAYGRYAATWMGQQGDIFYVGEGLSSSVAVSRFGGMMNYHNAGKVQASSQPQDMRLQRMLGHFTTLVPKVPKRVLVIGCGAGATAGAVSIDQHVESLTIAEIEPLVPRVVSEHFGEHNFHVVSNPKTHVVIDDARHFLLTTDERFDAITSDPLDPWVKGAATLYTKEFFELAKSKLNPGGTVTLFVQLYESTPEAVKSEIGTFFEVFPNGVIWGNTHQGRGYDTVLMGTVEPPHFDVDEWEARLNSPQYAAVKDSLREISIYSALDLFANYAGRASDMKAYTGRCADQSRPRSAAAVSRRPGAESVPERTDLRRDPAAQEVPGGSVQRIAGDAAAAPRGDRQRSRWRPAVRLTAGRSARRRTGRGI